jgi:hypothetical protein
MPRGDDEKEFTIDNAKCIRESEKAIFVKAQFFEDLGLQDGQVWIPKSQVTDNSEVFETDGEGKLIVTMWFARKSEWVDD